MFLHFDVVREKDRERPFQRLGRHLSQIEIQIENKDDAESYVPF